MRPRSITAFEQLMLGSILAATVQLVLQAAERLAVVREPLFQLLLGAGATALTVALVLLASRRRSMVAKWVLVVLTALGLAATLYDLSVGGPIDLPFGLGIVAIALQVAAVAMLFRRDAAAWFAGGEAAA